MSEYSTNGAMLACTCGTTPAPLLVTANTLTSIQGQYVATTSDKIPMTNINPFGLCKMKPYSGGHRPCVPAPTMWTGFLTSVELPGGNPLLKTSTIQCATGGLIQFKNSGQMKPNKVITNPDSPQIRALRKAAIMAVPFCEECEKRKKIIEQKAKLFDMYWIDENGEQQYKITPNVPVDLYIETIDYSPNEKFKILLECGEGKMFKNGKNKKEVSGVLDNNGILIIRNFEVIYDYEE